MKDYTVIAFDAQYYLRKNFCGLQSRTGYETVDCLKNHDIKCENNEEGYVITKYDFDYQVLVKQFVWTIVKMVRDKYTCDKLILLWDKPPYHKTTFVPDFKGDRTYHSQEILDEWDAESDPQGYLQECEEYRAHLIMQKAKYWIINNLEKLGLPSVIIDGFEADDLACIFSKIYSESGRKEKAAICSVDGDWLYWITPEVDCILSNRDERWVYQDVLDECEGVAQKLGMNLFEIKQWMDSTFYSHNALARTTNLGWKEFPQLVEEIRSGDYHNLTDTDRFNKNMQSFEYWKYPNYEDAYNTIHQLSNSEVQKSMEHYRKLVNDGFQVSESYIEKFFECI